MRRALVVIIFAFAAAGALANGQGEQGSPAVPVLDGFKSADAAGVNLQWQVDGDMLHVQVAAMTTGWVAVGFDPSSRMADANIIIGYVANGELTISDDYGVGPTRHAPDTANGGTMDVTNATGEERDGGTLIRFTIPLDSGDAWDRPLVPGESYRIILAHGPNGADNLRTRHSSRGGVTVEL